VKRKLIVAALAVGAFLWWRNRQAAAASERARVK
jgi:hypothetical protein